MCRYQCVIHTLTYSHAKTYQIGTHVCTFLKKTTNVKVISEKNVGIFSNFPLSEKNSTFTMQTLLCWKALIAEND